MTKDGKVVQLSRRLRLLADMVTSGHRVVDVGCDHGFLDVYLLQSGKVPSALAMDVRKGPLASAKEHISEAGLGEYIETRLSDGLEKYQTGEGDTLVCAGMGGPLMQKILTDYPEKTEDFQELLLQPQSELREFRIFLREMGYCVLEENILQEDGKYYFPMKVKKGEVQSFNPEEQEVFDRFGEGLLQRREPILKEFLLEQKRIAEHILQELKLRGEPDERRLNRLQEVKAELVWIDKALAFMN